jgi:multicomponent Na+:H+ antiporter subunit F
MNWTDPFLIALTVLLLCMLLAMIRVMLGPTAPDRVVALDTINTMVVAAMLLFGVAYREIIIIDVAIVYAVLSFITTLYIAKFLEGGKL